MRSLPVDLTRSPSACVGFHKALQFPYSPKTYTLCWLSHPLCVRKTLWFPQNIFTFSFFSSGWTANELISLCHSDRLYKWNYKCNMKGFSSTWSSIRPPRMRQEGPLHLSLEQFGFIGRVKSSKFSPGIENMNRVHGKLINTANPLDLFQWRVPARMTWDMQLAKASDWLTPHPLVSLPEHWIPVKSTSWHMCFKDLRPAS